MKTANARKQLLDAALGQAQAVGLENITRSEVSQAVGMIPRLVNYHVGDMGGLKNAVAQLALSRGCVPVIVQAIAMGRLHYADLPEALLAPVIEEFMS